MMGYLAGNSPAMQRINARAENIWAAVRAAEAALALVEADFAARLSALDVELAAKAAQIDAYERVLIDRYEIGERITLAALDCVRKIKADACRIFGISLVDLIGRSQVRRVSFARWYAAARLRDELGLSLTQIGGTLGGRDHSTVVNSLTPKNRARVAEWIKVSIAQGGTDAED